MSAINLTERRESWLLQLADAYAEAATYSERATYAWAIAEAREGA